MTTRVFTALSAVTLLVAAIAIPASSAVAAPRASEPRSSDGAVIDVKPTTATLNAKKRHTNFFVASFNAEAGETRFVGTELVVLDAKGTSPSELFLGVTLSCTSPSGRVTSAEAGRNVWPAGSSFMIPVGFTFVTDVAGLHRCAATVMMCNPGNCASPTGKGTVRIVTQSMNPRNYSVLYISPALPSWANTLRVPTTGDRIIKPNTSFDMTGSLDVGGSSGPVRIGGIFSITNCIEKAYPTVCKSAGATKIRGTALATLSLALKQEVLTPGTRCATAVATRANGAGLYRITWQQHHAVMSIYVPDFDLTEDPGCGTTVDVTVTVKAGKGNSLALESGSKKKITSVVYAIPGDIIPSQV
ncbi:MAG: hypothetical protein NWR17_06925 [Candidatus Nanopelagicales bacterium]|jgi:hypothetical protein|nr:hypothetical protein [Candidatus Nanopelagicales bacterium]MDP4714905.1 hypothetical protein [Candidatus Nanopelagicales bacterium]MDP4906980.1 hypothetical protein [Candidatus Nanopelagicales bacterium]MDP4975052.1 hypothetical protein [Candidatus Nanopelagicales bacterium]